LTQKLQEEDKSEEKVEMTFFSTFLIDLIDMCCHRLYMIIYRFNQSSNLHRRCTRLNIWTNMAWSERNLISFVARFADFLHLLVEHLQE